MKSLHHFIITKLLSSFLFLFVFLRLVEKMRHGNGMKVKLLFPPRVKRLQSEERRKSLKKTTIDINVNCLHANCLYPSTVVFNTICAFMCKLSAIIGRTTSGKTFQQHFLLLAIFLVFIETFIAFSRWVESKNIETKTNKKKVWISTRVILTQYFSRFQVVQEYERAVIFRLGRLMQGGAKGPGKVPSLFYYPLFLKYQ